jgi:exosortase
VVSALVAAALIAAFFPGLDFMVANWEQVEEYSYGYFIPVISAFLIWQRSDRLREAELRGSWTGLFAVVLGMLMGVVGDLSAIRIIGQYGFVIALVGLAVGFIGWRGVRIIAMPLLVLLYLAMVLGLYALTFARILQLTRSLI